uniref:Uncharacterized protein n=1 Tax=Panagrolaimus davidi TaxID=227884 RepID=A0A914PBW5_9BILA
MLSVVYRYRRLFIDDNSFDVKISSSFENLASLQYLQSAKFFKSKTFKKLFKMKNILPCSLFYVPSKFLQDFAFPSPIIRYITKEAQSGILQKLYQSCKYFFGKRRQPLCYYLSFWCQKDVDIQYFKNGINIRNANSYELRNICLTGALNEFSEIIPQIIPKLSESRLRYINFHMGNLSIAEYDFLTKSGEIEYFWMLFTKITVDGKDGNEPISLENLLKNLPKAEYLQ